MTEIQPTLPASWYCSSSLHKLERRAVFLRAWYLLGPVTKYENEIDVDYEIAEVRLTVQKRFNSENQIHIKVLDINGCELMSHRTSTGLLFTTISSEAPSFNEFYPGLEDVLASVSFSDRPHRQSLSYEGKYNWKVLIDGYQECLHCKYTHPAFSAIYPTSSYSVINHKNWSRHITDPDNSNDGLFLYLFPVCTLNVYGGGWSTFRVSPMGNPGVSKMDFEYYHRESGDKFEDYYQFVRQVANEDFELCERVQANLERGIYTAGCLNPAKESGVAHYQQQLLDIVCEQHEKEKNV